MNQINNKNSGVISKEKLHAHQWSSFVSVNKPELDWIRSEYANIVVRSFEFNRQQLGQDETRRLMSVHFPRAKKLIQKYVYGDIIIYRN